MPTSDAKPDVGRLLFILLIVGNLLMFGAWPWLRALPLGADATDPPIKSIRQERLRQNLGGDFGSSELAAEIVLWAAYANRLIGENFCCTVIDGGTPEAGSVSLARAEGQFTEAFDLANAAGATDFAIAAKRSASWSKSLSIPCTSKLPGVCTLSPVR